MNITSAQYRSIKHDAFSLIADIRESQKKFEALMARAKDAGLSVDRSKEQSDTSLLGQVAAHASEEEINILRRENVEEVNSYLNGGTSGTQPRTSIGRFFRKVSNIVG